MKEDLEITRESEKSLPARVDKVASLGILKTCRLAGI